MSGAMTLPSDELKHRKKGLEFVKRAWCNPYVDVSEPSDNYVREMVECMRKKDAHQLLAIQRQMEEDKSMISGFLLTEPLFSSKTLLELRQNASPIPLITGNTWYEMNHLTRDYVVTIADSLGFQTPTRVAEKFKEDSKESNFSFNTTGSETQSLFLSSQQTASALTKRGSKCYLYSYRYWRHPRHTDDLSYIMGVHRFEPDENEAVLAKVYPQYFLNFVKTGVPDPDWQPYRMEDDNYFSVDFDIKTGLKPTNALHFEKQVIDYWTKDMKAYDDNVTSACNVVGVVTRAVGVSKQYTSQYVIIEWFYSTIAFGMALFAGVLLGRLSLPKRIVVQLGADEKTPLFLK